MIMMDSKRLNDQVGEGFGNIESGRQLVSQFQPIEEGIFLFKASTRKESGRSFSVPVPKEYILFAFCMEGEVTLHTSISEDRHVLNANNSYLLSNPYSDWHLTVHLHSSSELQILGITILKLHSFFGLIVQDARVNEGEFMKGFRFSSYYSEKTAHPSIKVCIHQLFQAPGLEGISKTFFRKSKILEFLALFMNRAGSNVNAETNCPYLSDSMQEERIRQAEKIIIEKMQNPPTIRELARLVGTNESRLKSDFRILYGETIYGHLLRHRMETARDLLDRKKMQVQQVADRVGYSNTSHFISAFKKQFGITPKKYLQGN
jgi:AraC-like DNA-binding protein